MTQRFQKDVLFGYPLILVWVIEDISILIYLGLDMLNPEQFVTVS